MFSTSWILASREGILQYEVLCKMAHIVHWPCYQGREDVWNNKQYADTNWNKQKHFKGKFSFSKQSSSAFQTSYITQAT